MKRKVSVYIKDIIENMEKAENFIANLSYEDFLRDEKTCYAVQRCLEIIGEATKNVPDDIRQIYPSIPWKAMAGMRDKIIHFYFGVDPQKVWLVVKKDIPELKPLLKKILSEISKLENQT